MDTELKQAVSHSQLNPDLSIKMAKNGDNHEKLILMNIEAVTIAIGQSLHKNESNFPQIIECAKAHRRFHDLSLLISHAPIDIIESHIDMLCTVIVCASTNCTDREGSHTKCTSGRYETRCRDDFD